MPFAPAPSRGVLIWRSGHERLPLSATVPSACTVTSTRVNGFRGDPAPGPQPRQLQSSPFCLPYGNCGKVSTQWIRCEHVSPNPFDPLQPRRAGGRPLSHLSSHRGSGGRGSWKILCRSGVRMTQFQPLGFNDQRRQWHDACACGPR